MITCILGLVKLGTWIWDSRTLSLASKDLSTRKERAGLLLWITKNKATHRIVTARLWRCNSAWKWLSRLFLITLSFSASDFILLRRYGAEKGVMWCVYIYVCVCVCVCVCGVQIIVPNNAIVQGFWFHITETLRSWERCDVVCIYMCVCVCVWCPNNCS